MSHLGCVRAGRVHKILQVWVAIKKNDLEPLPGKMSNQNNKHLNANITYKLVNNDHCNTNIDLLERNFPGNISELEECERSHL